MVKVGHRYKHFKEKEYIVLHLARDSETQEELVVYKAAYGEEIVWVRPLNMFFEQVVVDGKLVNRFDSE